jgi:hypothetical protein
MPSSLRATNSISYSSRLQARRARSFSAGESRRLCQARHRGSTSFVSDIEAAQAELVNRGVEVSEVFHDVGGVFHHAGREGRLNGPDPQRRSYASFASFSDPDGNGWFLQEVTVRLPGRVDADNTTFTSATELASALRRAEAAHGEYEKRLGQRDADWPIWYAEHIIREQAGKPLPS